MNHCRLIIMLAAVSCLGACSNYPKDSDQSAEWPRDRRMTMNRWMVSDLQDQHVAGAVIAQHTLYPHHFVANASALNDLGLRDAHILADRYRDHPGTLNIRRGSEGDELYGARVQAVKDLLADNGVDVSRVAIADASAGGDGLVSERVLVILDEKIGQPLSEDKPMSHEQ
ncbi:MAG: hypothetical protein IT445_11895 [Phycisphaeraceae bacterium]|nr:hypothetical protein [Phycisphaeraceae bacterium]